MREQSVGNQIIPAAILMLLALRARSRTHRSLSDSAFTEGVEAKDMCTDTTQDAKTQLENLRVFLNCLNEFPCQMGGDAVSQPT